MAGNVVLLERIFAIYPKTTTEYRVSLTHSDISYLQHEPSVPPKSSARVMVIKFLDVIGADCMRGKTADCSSAYLNVYSYPYQRKFASKNSLRKRHCVTFVFSQFPSFDENHRDAMQWQLVITYLSRRMKVKLEGN